MYYKNIQLLSIAQLPLVHQGSSYGGFTITIRHTTVGRTPLDE